MILALELSDSWSSGGVTCSCKDEGGVTRLHTQCGWVSRTFRHVPWIRERLPICQSSVTWHGRANWPNCVREWRIMMGSDSR